MNSVLHMFVDVVVRLKNLVSVIIAATLAAVIFIPLVSFVRR